VSKENQDPIEKKETLLQGYEQLLREDRFDLLPYTVLRTWNKIKYNVRDMLEPEIKDKRKKYRFLDIGCERGFDVFSLLKHFSDYNIEFVGIDISSEKIVVANKKMKEKGISNCTFLQGNAEELNFPSESFDFILCSEVIEHLYKPEKALKDMYKILKKDGYLILTTPNPDNKMGMFVPRFFKNRWADWMGERKNVKATGDEPHAYVYHIGELSINEWIKMCKATGFQVLETRRAEFIYGSKFFDRHQMLTGFTVFLDGILDNFTHYFSWNVQLKLRKSK
jgi:ubiquinone/menaquinone biosynthesis C-methylase UbiE